jgi:gamma-glutamyltranspeptidase / glutathione hydrolase
MEKSRAGLSLNLSLRAELRKPAARSKGGIVVSQHRLASEIGAHVLADGGHAVDAAVATSFAVGVLEPWMNGIGGIGAMLVRSGDQVAALEFGARSPAALDPADYPIVQGAASDLFDWPRVKDDRNLIGAKAVVAPRLVAGMAAAHRRHGRKPWRDLVAPAAALAADGMVVDWHTLLMLGTAHAQLAHDPGCAAVFLPGGTLPVPPPAVAPNPVIRLPNPALARTLEAIADDPAAFYRGPIARALVDDVCAAGGVLAQEDMAAVEAREVAPITYRHRDRTIYALPELTGGPTMLDAFVGLDRRWRGGALDGAAFTAIAASLREAWDKRFATMGDTAQTGAASSTTHLSVVDRDGNMVALTQTLLSLFGARFLSPATGILLNNGINWFDPRPGRPNSIAAGKRTLSNYCPAVMLGADDAAAIGGCGGRKILPAVFQLLVMMANGSSLDAAFHAPRIDVSGGDTVVVDRDLPVEVRAALSGAFKTLEVERTAYPAHFTIASGVRRSGGMNEGATEPHHPWSEAVAED